MDLSENLDVVDLAPSAAEFASMRAACGWGPISTEVATRALAASAIHVSVRRKPGKLLGFGRVVGDGILYFYIQDVIVQPEVRGEGIGRLIMERLMARVHKIAPVGATIGLMSAAGKEGFYERFGFMRRPTESYGSGMTQLVR